MSIENPMESSEEYTDNSSKENLEQGSGSNNDVNLPNAVSEEVKPEKENLQVTNRITILGAHGCGVGEFSDALEVFYPENKKLEKPDITFTTRAQSTEEAIFNQIPREVAVTGIDKLLNKNKTKKELPSEGPSLPKRIVVFSRMSGYDPDTLQRVNVSPIKFVQEICEEHNIPLTVVKEDFNEDDIVPMAKLVEQIIKEDISLGNIDLDEDDEGSN